MAKKRFLVLVVAIAAIGLSGCATTSQLGAGTVELKSGVTAPSWRLTAKKALYSTTSGVMMYKSGAVLRLHVDVKNTGNRPAVFFKIGDADPITAVSDSALNWELDAEVVSGVMLHYWSCDIAVDSMLAEVLHAAPLNSVSVRVYNGGNEWVPVEMPPADWEGWK